MEPKLCQNSWENVRKHIYSCEEKEGNKDEREWRENVSREEGKGIGVKMGKMGKNLERRTGKGTVERNGREFKRRIEIGIGKSALKMIREK
jgi:hypothetical protein